MKLLPILAICILLAGCALKSYDNSHSIFGKVVGQWEWEDGPPGCRDLVNMAFRGNGTYTRTSESCDFADDGFGDFYYGWYVANEHICFVEVEEQFDDEEPRMGEYKKIYKKALSEGYLEERCTWKIERIENKKIFIIQKYRNGEVNSFVMQRKRWL